IPPDEVPRPGVAAQPFRAGASVVAGIPGGAARGVLDPAGAAPGAPMAMGGPEPYCRPARWAGVIPLAAPPPRPAPHTDPLGRSAAGRPRRDHGAEELLLPRGISALAYCPLLRGGRLVAPVS